MNRPIEFGAVFHRLAQERHREMTVEVGGVNARMVRVAGGGEARWDSHTNGTETAVVRRGDFTVEFGDHKLTAGQGSVVPVGAQHRGTSRNGPEVVLFQPCWQRRCQRACFRPLRATRNDGGRRSSAPARFNRGGPRKVRRYTAS